ncbi:MULTISPECIES: GNAT family N-acetyltransferase [unclassified Nocardioides]|uniref:GNAT family N-acetyltransferase n=1 Tax=unclassified Nocardioides TaxID=2615069 RepID=UPI003014C0E0
MSRKVVRLTVDHLARLPDPVRTCLFWELDPVRRSRVRPEEAAEEKEAWLSEVLREWGSCGRVVLVDDEVAGLAVYAPEAFLPGAAGFPTAPVSPDAILLATVYVDPARTGGGLGRLLVQGMARDLIGRGGVSAVEAFGHRTRRGVAQCTVPADFLGSVGFKTQRPHPTTPRMRMDLRTALTWREEVESALERLVGVVRPAPKPMRPPTPSRVSGSVPRASQD